MAAIAEIFQNLGAYLQDGRDKDHTVLEQLILFTTFSFLAFACLPYRFPTKILLAILFLPHVLMNLSINTR
jgi:hypothetical protein